MTMRVRTGLVLIVALAAMGMASCGHYVCGANFGNSTCAAGPPSLGGGNGGNTGTAFAFVANGTASPGTIVGYTLNTSAAPPTLKATANYTPPTTPGNDSGIGMTVAQKQFLYAAFGSTQNIFGWSISSAGILTPVSGSPYSVPLLATGTTSIFDTARVITNPAGTLLFVGDEFGNQIFVYQIASGGVLTAVVGSPFLVPFPPGNMTTDGLGTYLYFTDTSLGNHTGSQIAAYSIGSSGTLTAVAGSPFGFPMWQVQGEPTGLFLIGTKGFNVFVNGADDNNLYVFSIAQGGATPGAITQVGAAVPTIYSPFNIATESNAGGNLVDTFGLDDLATSFNPVESYALSSSGALTRVNGSPFLNAAVGTEGKFDQSGGLLFVYGGIFQVNTVVYTLTSFDVSAGNLTTPTPTGTYGGFWVVTDAP